jgi:hypothetical protein
MNIDINLNDIDSDSILIDTSVCKLVVNDESDIF